MAPLPLDSFIAGLIDTVSMGCAHLTPIAGNSRWPAGSKVTPGISEFEMATVARFVRTMQEAAATMAYQAAAEAEQRGRLVRSFGYAAGVVRPPTRETAIERSRRLAREESRKWGISASQAGAF